MRYKTLALSILSLLLTFTALHAGASVARAADNDDDNYKDDDYGYEETARVVRVSLIAGDVSLRRAGSEKWEHAALNLPLVEGDRLATGANSRLEIQIDSRNFLRVGEYATLDIITLRDEGVALSLPTGTATLRLAHFDHDHEYFEIDAPGTTVAAEKQGLYRLDVDESGKVRVAVRDGGRARLYSESNGFTLRDGRVAEMVFANNSTEADWEFSDVRPFDNFDTWVDDRERYLLARLRYDGRDRYYDTQVWGAEELDAYGDWVETHDYGYVWRPRVTVINNYNNWAPYRYGHWDWCPPYGWVWVGDEPWGWAPYHYGRWVYYNNDWCWAPRGYFGYRHHSWWRPALVAFVNIHLSFGDNICWYPLPYHHSDPHSNFWRRSLRPDRLTALRRNELANLQRVSPIYQRAVSGLPARDFSRGGIRPQPADVGTAKLALATDPVRGRLPIRPVESEGGEANLRDRLSASKRAAIAARGSDGATAGDPARAIPERRTGAGKRQPGVALDEELRRERILNNREPVITKGAKGGSSKDSDSSDPTRRINDGDTHGTGAVARPARPVRLPDANGASERRGDKSGGEDPKRTIRPVLPSNPETENERPRDPIVNAPTERKVKPDVRERRDGEGGGDKNLSPYDRSARPDERESRPVMPERERQENRPAPSVERRESPPERRAEPTPRYERPEPRREERPSPPPREERQSPPPREERSSPPPREERSAPREEKSSSPSKSEERRSEPSRDTAKPSREKPPESK
ncbi:MAG: hypothetical protein QOF61_173 [Acidobacteriota bacterium]|nr:hypothetical protein [Acidobacteriota bacterium]